MSRWIGTLVLISLFLGRTANAQQAVGSQGAQVTIDAHAERISETEAELVVTAQIAPGLHIYAQSQPKPFLATRIQVEANSSIASVSDFIADQQPLRIRHPQLNVDLIEHEEQVQWRARVTLAANDPTTAVPLHGTVFAQACEAQRCFAPQTYTFETTIPNFMADSAATPTEAFQLDQIESAAAASQSVWTVLPLAFAAGFLLNFMPCVLPVVGLKLLSFVQQANSDRRRVLLMNISYTAGLLSVMLVLATLAVFAGLGWGEQFSSAAFTITLASIVFAFGLSFLGVWEIPLPGFVGAIDGKSQKQEGYGAAFSKGILSTLLATPCSGPFLGAALAWAIAQPTHLTYLVFATVGIGMASPYLVVGMFPGAIRFLPKPGAWMVGFKQAMGFVMLTTVIYLMSFMPVAAVVPTTLLLLGLSVALWIVGKTPTFAPMNQQVRAWAVGATITVLFGAIAFWWLDGVMQQRFERAAQRLLADRISSPSQASHTALPTASTKTMEVTSNSAAASDHIAWQAYSPQRLQNAIRAGQPVFVDFTADWCLTCKANEAAAIETPEFATAIRDGSVLALKADKTTPNPEADALLRKLGNKAASIPYYAVFSPHEPTRPKVLDGVFPSPKPFVSAIRQIHSAQAAQAAPSDRLRLPPIAVQTSKATTPNHGGDSKS